MHWCHWLTFISSAIWVLVYLVGQKLIPVIVSLLAKVNTRVSDNRRLYCRCLTTTASSSITTCIYVDPKQLPMPTRCRDRIQLLKASFELILLICSRLSNDNTDSALQDTIEDSPQILWKDRNKPLEFSFVHGILVPPNYHQPSQDDHGAMCGGAQWSWLRRGCVLLRGVSTGHSLWGLRAEGWGAWGWGQGRKSALVVVCKANHHHHPFVLFADHRKHFLISLYDFSILVKPPSTSCNFWADNSRIYAKDESDIFLKA